MENATVVFESDDIKVEATPTQVFLTGEMFFDVAGQGLVSDKGPASVSCTPADMKAIVYAWIEYIKSS
jgi:hypothetical protein